MWFWTEFHPVFPFSLASPLSQLATYIFTGPPCKATIINLEFCTSNDLIKFPYFMNTSVRRVWGERRPKERVTLQIILVFTLAHPKIFTQGCVSVFDKYLHWPCVSVNKYIHCNRISVSVKNLDVYA